MLEMAVSLGAACQSGAAAQGTRGDVKEIQREEWKRAYHKGSFIHMGHLDPVVQAPCFSQVNNIWISSKGKCLR